MTEARPLPLGVPAFRPIPQKAVANEPLPTALNAQRRIAVDSTQPRVSVNNILVDTNEKPVSLEFNATGIYFNLLDLSALESHFPCG